MVGLCSWPGGVDAETVQDMLTDLRDDLKARRFVPQLVREKAIPKASGKVRRLGIATTLDRIVQASLKLVLEPIFEADFKPCSYGFRPRRRAQDAIAEIHCLATPVRNYQWVFEADIAACFDEISHSGLMGRVRKRVGDKRVLHLVKAVLRAGILTEAGQHRQTITGSPQGGILSPLLANIALSILDEHFTTKWELLEPAWKRARHRRSGGPSMKIIRYADDFVSWSTELGNMLTRCGMWSQKSWCRWVYACQWPRPGSATWTMDLISSAGTSSAATGEVKMASKRFTPTRRRRPSRP